MFRVIRVAVPLLVTTMLVLGMGCNEEEKKPNSSLEIPDIKPAEKGKGGPGPAPPPR